METLSTSIGNITGKFDEMKTSIDQLTKALTGKFDEMKSSIDHLTEALTGKKI